MLLPAPVLLGAQTVINRLLLLDPESHASASELEGKVFKVEVKGPGIEIYLMFLHDGVELSRFYDDEPDVVLSGSVFALLSLLRNSDSLFDGTVSVAGDTSSARKLKQIMDEMDVDWEEQLSGVVGDTASHQFFRVASGFRQLFEQGTERLRSETADFLRGPAGVAVNEEEVRDFCQSVDTIRNDVDRMEARIASLEKTLPASGHE